MRSHAPLFAVMSILSLLATPAAAGDDPERADADIGDGPVVKVHVSQADCESGRLTLDQIMARGSELFTAKFNTFDGQGRPASTGNGTPSHRVPGSAPRFIRTSAPDSNSCAGCHNDPRTGAGGDIVTNVFVLAQVRDPVTDSVGADSSDERNTLGMMGAGPIEMLAREMTADLQALRDQALSEARGRGLPASRDLVTKGVRFGRITARPDGTLDTSEVQGVSPDLIVRPFHQKGAVVSLREFTVSAFNHHHGMQAVERFGRARTGTDDFDEDGVPDELTVGDITAATIFQATLNTPGRVIPRDPGKVRAIERGQSTFETIGCAECHRPALVLNNRMFSEPDPYNPPGNLRPEDVSRPVTFDLTRDGQLPRPERLPDGRALVRAYTDLKRHDLCDAEIDHFCNERVVQGGISTRQFLTRKLWDVGNSAPYGHRGDLTTITEAILAHGGEGRVARDAFGALPKERRDELVEFLKSLQILPEGTPTLVVHERGPAAGDAGSFQ